MNDRNAIRNFMIGAMTIMGVSLIFANGTSASNVKVHEPYDIPTSAPKILGLTMLKSTFSDAGSLLGEAEKYHASQDEEAPIQVCYRSRVNGDATTLILESGFTGGWVDLSGYKLMNFKPDKKHSCTVSNLIDHNLKVLDGNIWLGMTKKEVLTAIGKPRTRNYDNLSKDELPKNDNPNHWIYLTTWSIPFTEADKKTAEETFGANSLGKNPHWDAWTDVELTFKSSKLVEVFVYHGITD
jgi:hypothetical protein